MKTVFFILSLSRRSIFNKTTLRALAFFSFVLVVSSFSSRTTVEQRQHGEKEQQQQQQQQQRLVEAFW